MKNVSETSKNIVLNTPLSSIQGFNNELMFNPSVGETDAEAFVIPNGNIIVRTEKLLFSLDKYGNVLWEKKKAYNKILMNQYSKYFIAYNYSKNFFEVWDFNGNIIKKFYDPDSAIIVNVGFKGGKIYFSSYSYDFDCKTHMPSGFYRHYKYILFFTILDLNFNIVWRKELENTHFYRPEGTDSEICWYFNYFAIPNERGEPVSFLCAHLEFFKWITDQNNGESHFKSITHKAIFELNGVPYSTDFKMYNNNSFGSEIISGFELINDSTLIFLSPPNYLILVNVNSFDFKRIGIPYVVANTILRLNDTCFVVSARSLNHNEIGFAVFNHKCKLLDTFFIQCHFGAVRSLAITPNRDILIAGTRNINQDTSFVFLVSIDLPLIRDIIGYKLSVEQQNSKHNLLVSPNPTDGFFKIELKPTPDKLTIELFDIIGNRVKVLFDGFWNEKNLFFDISDLPQSIYFLKVISGNSIQYYKVYNIRN